MARWPCKKRPMWTPRNREICRKREARDPCDATDERRTTSAPSCRPAIQRTASDADGDTLVYGLAVGQGLSNGSVVIQPNGTCTYTPAADYVGGDSVTFTVSDGRGGIDTATVTLVIAAAPTPPSPITLADIAAGWGGFKIVGEQSGDQAGISVSAAGDVNGDGLSNQIVGAFGRDGSTGAAYLVFDGTDGPVDLDDVAAGRGGLKLFGEARGTRARVSVSAAGDVNGDGLADLLIGAGGNGENGRGTGAAYIVFGRSGWTVAMFGPGIRRDFFVLRRTRTGP